MGEKLAVSEADRSRSYLGETARLVADSIRAPRGAAAAAAGGVGAAGAGGDRSAGGPADEHLPGVPEAVVREEDGSRSRS